MDTIDFIYNEVRKFNKSILIDGSFGNADFATLLRRYPKIALYINSYKCIPQRGLFGGSKTAIIFGYKNQNVKYEDIYPCNSVNEMENVLSYNLKKYNTHIAYVVPNQSLMQELTKRIPTGSLSAKYPFFKGFSTLNGGVLPFAKVAYFYIEVQYHVNPSELREMERVIEPEINRVASMLFDPLMPKEAKVLLAHNYLCHIATYDPSYLNKSITFNPWSHSAYGCLIKHVCVCHGFSEAFKRILNRGGVTCEIITGQIKGTTTQHAWNIVKIDDDYYHVDVTFDDQSEIVFNYFMKTDEEMKRDRTWDTSSYPKCNGRKNIMMLARSYINLNKSKLILRGVKIPMLKTL